MGGAPPGSRAAGGEATTEAFLEHHRRARRPHRRSGGWGAQGHEGIEQDRDALTVQMAQASWAWVTGEPLQGLDAEGWHETPHI